MANDVSSSLLNFLNKRDTSSIARTGTDLKLDSNVPFGIPTYIPQLDLSMKRPGYPAGRIIELYGKPACGKTTAAYHAIASVQRTGGLGACMFVDTEYTYSPSRARECGVDPDNLIVVTASNIEEAFEHTNTFLDWLVKSEWNGPSIFVVDSITGVPAKSEMEKEFEERSTLGADARAIRKALRILNPQIAKTKTLGVFVNHSSAKMASTPFAKDSESAGGRALKYFSSVRVNFAFVGSLFEGEKEEKVRKGQIVNIEIEKNKVNHTGRPAFRVELTEHGFDLYDGLLNAMISTGYIERQTKQTNFWKSEEISFAKAKWNDIVDSKGGPWKVYCDFLKIAAEDGIIFNYRPSAEEEVSDD